MKDNILIIIPAYNPGEKLVKLIKALKDSQYSKILVINDGSEKNDIFQKIREEVIIVEHKENKGKGQALKTGFNYCINNMKNVNGVITVDADGQHIIEDINKVYDEFQKDASYICLGSRNFEKDNIPFRSRLGNKIISKVLEKKTNISIRDTQTGLRALPIQYMKKLIEIPGERFEYETNMLLYCIKEKINIKEIPIKSIYFNKNKGSNFKVLKDSLQIYNTIIKY